MINKLDSGIKPTKQDLKEIIKDRFIDDFCAYVEKEYAPKEQIDYSKCSAAPGWNLKYKLKGKTVCTIYPDKDYFTVLITMNYNDNDKFNIVKDNFLLSTTEMIERAKPMNGTKWLMLKVSDVESLRDAKKLIALKYSF